MKRSNKKLNMIKSFKKVKFQSKIKSKQKYLCLIFMNNWTINTQIFINGVNKRYIAKSWVKNQTTGQMLIKLIKMSKKMKTMRRINQMMQMQLKKVELLRKVNKKSQDEKVIMKTK